MSFLHLYKLRYTWTIDKFQQMYNNVLIFIIKSKTIKLNTVVEVLEEEVAEEEHQEEEEESL